MTQDEEIELWILNLIYTTPLIRIATKDLIDATDSPLSPVDYQGCMAHIEGLIKKRALWKGQIKTGTMIFGGGNIGIGHWERLKAKKQKENDNESYQEELKKIQLEVAKGNLKKFTWDRIAIIISLASLLFSGLNVWSYYKRNKETEDLKNRIESIENRISNK